MPATRDAVRIERSRHDQAIIIFLVGIEIALLQHEGSVCAQWAIFAAVDRDQPNLQHSQHFIFERQRVSVDIELVPLSDVIDDLPERAHLMIIARVQRPLARGMFLVTLLPAVVCPRVIGQIAGILALGRVQYPHDVRDEDRLRAHVADQAHAVWRLAAPAVDDDAWPPLARKAQVKKLRIEQPHRQGAKTRDRAQRAAILVDPAYS